MRTDPDAQAMQAALDALEEARDDIGECMMAMEHGKGYPKYDRRLAEYEAQLKRHDAAITALRERLADSAGAKAVAEINQCDGCRQGAPINAYGNHVNSSGVPFMFCQKYRYATPPVQEALEKVIGLCDENHDKHLIAAIRAIRPEDIKGE